MKMYLLGALLCMMSAFIGAEAANILTGDLIVIRDAAGMCSVFDTGVGKGVGNMQPTNDRCHLRDWRAWHLFG